MEFLYFLENIRTPFFDFLFSIITYLGDKSVFLVIGLVFFWCIEKREGYYVILTGLIGTVINQWLKLIFKIPRPWVKDPSFTIVESSREAATGYSFPSGHTQNVTGTLGTLAIRHKSTPVRIVLISLIALTAFSRMYLGVHTPLDVSVSLLVGAALVFLLYPIFSEEEHFNKLMPYTVAFTFVLSLAELLFVFALDKGSVDSVNLLNGKENAVTLFACSLGIAIVYFVDRYFVKFDTHAAWYAQIIKVIGGVAGVLLIKALFKTPLNLLFGNEFVGRFVRYFLLVIYAGCIWPMTFRYFSRLRIPIFDKLTKRKHDNT